MMTSGDGLQNWYARLDRRSASLLTGAAVGAAAGGIGLLLALGGPVVAAGVILGALAALYILTDVRAALYGVVAVMVLLPFGTLPVRVGFTPTFLDAALGAFLLVYLLQWATGKRRRFLLTPIHPLIGLYVLWLVVAFALGLRFASPTQQVLRQFLETLLSIGLAFVLVDLLRDAQTLRRLVLVVLVLITLQALVAIGLWLLPDALAENLLVRLARLGYPDGGVIRYIEADPAQPERAIGTWVDPNTLGGILAVSAAMFAPQVFAPRPVLRWRLLTLGALGVVGVALALTFSRSSMVALAAGLVFIALFPGYRRFLPLLAAGAGVILVLPQTQVIVTRFVEGFAGQDLATQMRFGEYSDSLRLIGQYPLTGVGFTGTPSIDLYTHAASLYLIMANMIGLTGVGIFLLAMGGVFVYGLRVRQAALSDPELGAIFLGYHAALLTALVNGATDLYFFRIDFHASITLFWLTVGLALASTRLTVDKGRRVV